MRRGSTDYDVNLVYKLGISFIFRKNFVTILGIILYDQHSICMLRSFHDDNAVRLKQLPLTETTDVAMPVHGKSAQEQFFKVIFQETQIHAHASKYCIQYLAGSYHK
jgi:hypothetical protein